MTRPLAILALRLCAASLAASCSPASADAACRSTVMDSRSVRVVDGHPVVTVSVNGEPVSMLLDTGASASFVTRATAARFGLPVESRRATVTGIDGTRRREVVRVTLGMVGAGQPLSLPVIDLPGGTDNIAGVVGTDVLSAFDLDLDQPGGQVTFRCPASRAPWPARQLPATFTPAGGILLPVRLGGTTLEALLDTGNPGSILAPSAARRAGLTDERVAAGTAFTVLGTSLAPVTVRALVLDDVAVGPERVPSLSVAVASFELPGPDMLLGNDFLLHRRMLISWARREVWVRGAD